MTALRASARPAGGPGGLAAGDERVDHRAVEREPLLGRDLVGEHAQDGLAHRPVVHRRGGAEPLGVAQHEQAAAMDDGQPARVRRGRIAGAGEGRVRQGLQSRRGDPVGRIPPGPGRAALDGGGRRRGGAVGLGVEHAAAQPQVRRAALEAAGQPGAHRARRAVDGHVEQPQHAAGRHDVGGQHGLPRPAGDEGARAHAPGGHAGRVARQPDGKRPRHPGEQHQRPRARARW